MVIGGCDTAAGGLPPIPACGIMDAVGPDAEPDVGTACVKGVGTTALAVLCPSWSEELDSGLKPDRSVGSGCSLPLLVGGNDKGELASADDYETGVCSAIAVASCSATFSCTPSCRRYLVLLSNA